MKKALSKQIKEFPNIFRNIPESKITKSSLKSKNFFYLISGFILILSLVILLGILVLTFNIYNNSNILMSTLVRRQGIEVKIAFWRSITDKYPSYKDAYFQIAVLEYQLGDLAKARDADKKALLLDPSFGNAEKLSGLLGLN